MNISIIQLEKKTKKIGMHNLNDPRSRKMADFTDIEMEVIRFYKELFVTNIQHKRHVDIVAIREGSQLLETRRNTYSLLPKLRRFFAYRPPISSPNFSCALIIWEIYSESKKQ